MRQVLGTGEKISMDMRFSDMRYFHVVLTGNVEVCINVSFWIDDDGNTTFLASDEVTPLRQGLVIDMLKKHNVPLRIGW